MIDAAVPANALLDEADTLRAADAWQVNGFSVWEAVKVQIAAETPEPTPFRADALRHTVYEVYAEENPIPSPKLAARIAHLEETQPDAVREARAQASRIPVIDVTVHSPGAESLAALPADTARQYRALPMRKIGNKLWVAWEEMPPVEAIDAVRSVSRCQVIPMLAKPKGAWDAVFAAAYPPSAELVATDPTDALFALVRDLQAEVALLRTEVETLRKQIAAPVPPRPVSPFLHRTYAPPLFPLTTPGD